MFESAGGRVPAAPPKTLKRHLQALWRRLRRRRHTSFHTREDVERTLGLPVLAVYAWRRDR